MAKSGLAGADGALTWAVSAARAGGRIVRGPRKVRAGAGSAAGALAGCRQGLLPRAFLPAPRAAGGCPPATSGRTPRREGPRLRLPAGQPFRAPRQKIVQSLGPVLGPKRYSFRRPVPKERELEWPLPFAPRLGRLVLHRGCLG